MNKCIWCSKTQQNTTFKKLAHTIPQTLGGQNICKNVCDDCNLTFGSYFEKLPPVETVLKETFNITRARLLSTSDNVGKNKPLSRFKSIYFKVDFDTHKVTTKATYKFNKAFQQNICRQLKKGLYKVFLEESERQKGNGHDSTYDFIREFARYNLGDYPVFYFERQYGILLMSENWIKNPELFMDPNYQAKYLVNEPSFYEFELLGHVFGIATSRHWELALDNYIKKSVHAKKELFKSWKLINNFNDIDLTLNVLNG
jgi:hypothetical protein